MKFFDPRDTYWFWSCRFLKPYPDWPSRHFIRPLGMLGDHCLTSKNPKIQVAMIWPYSGLFGLYGLEAQIASIG